MRLIDADALREQISETYEYEFPTASGGFDEFATKIIPNIINNAITADVVPVVRGEWICNPDDKKFSLVCSVCGQVMPFVPEYLPDCPPFCNCGADMRGESEAKE